MYTARIKLYKAGQYNQLQVLLLRPPVVVAANTYTTSLNRSTSIQTNDGIPLILLHNVQRAMLRNGPVERIYPASRGPDLQPGIFGVIRGRWRPHGSVPCKQSAEYTPNIPGSSGGQKGLEWEKQLTDAWSIAIAG